MKKLSQRHRKLLLKRSRAGNRRMKRGEQIIYAAKQTAFLVDMWDGKEIEEAVCLYPPEKPPSVLCFHQNTDETLKFIRKLNQAIDARPVKRRYKSYWVTRRPKRKPLIRGYFSFEEIEFFSTAPALILAAIYERAKEASGEIPPTINFPNWSAHAFQTLYEIGFFEIVGHAPAEKIIEVYNEKLDSAYKVSKTITGKNADGLEQASDVILELLDYLSVDPVVAADLIPEINSAVSEAMINVARHAYQTSFVESLSHVCLQKWWMSARADRRENTLTIAFYDQGETIPGTLPQRDWFRETVENTIRAVIPDFIYDSAKRTVDHEFINYSMKEGKTQTGHSRRGLGLPQMKELVDVCPDGTLSILSRQGLYKYGKGVGVFKRSLDVELEGTLVEWKLALPRG